MNGCHHIVQQPMPSTPSTPMSGCRHIVQPTVVGDADAVVHQWGEWTEEVANCEANNECL